MKSYHKISFFLLIGSILFLYSCKSEKKICAAYNSYFVYDATNNGFYFTSFGADSTPSDSSSKRFNSRGIISNNGKRNINNGNLENININELKKSTVVPDTSLMGDFDDSTGSILSTKELFPEKVNTDQEAYDHYVGELLKKYQKEHPRPKAPVDTVSSKEPFPKPENMTDEEKVIWKQEKKERKLKEKERKRKEREDANKEEEDDDFDFDLGDL